MSRPLARRIGFGLATALSLIAAGFIAAHIPRTMTIFLIAAFIAFGVAPIVQRFERAMPRGLAIASVYLLLLGALIVLALVVVPTTYGQVLVLVGHAGDYAAAAQSAVGRLADVMRAHLGPRVTLPTVEELQSQVSSRVDSLFAFTLSSVGAILIGTINALTVAASALILSVFFLLRGRDVQRGLLALVPPSRRAKTHALLVEVATIFGHFVAGQAALSVIVGIAVWLVLVPAHVPLALLVAVACAIGYAVPFIGMIAAQLVAALLTIPQGSSQVIYVTVAIFVIARVADSVLVPKIMGDSVGVSPIGVMFAVFAGGELFGVPGLLLAIPIAALVRVLFTYFVLPWIVRAQLAEAGLGDGAEPVFPEVPDVVITVAERRPA